MPKISDTRIFLFLLCLSAMLIWQLSLTALVVLIPVIVSFYFYKTQDIRHTAFLGLCTFTIFWIMAIFLIQSIGFENKHFVFNNTQENLFFSLHFGLRLTAMGIIGLLIAHSISAIELAYVTTWFFSFFSTKQAWKIGLLCFLVLHLIPHFFQIALEIKQNIEYRLATTKGHFLYKIKLFFINFIKQLAIQNTELSQAIIIRGMYSEHAYSKKWNKLSLATIFSLKFELLLLLLVIYFLFV